MEELDGRTLIALVDRPVASAEDMLREMLVGFGVVRLRASERERLARASRDELLAALRHFLTSLVPLGAFAVVVVDEAQRLPIEALQQIRAFAEMPDDPRLLQIVLVGQPALASRLRTADLAALESRVTVRATLGPLAAEEIVDYVSHRLSVAGANPRVDFSDAAAETIFERSGGVPAIVNLLCDRALVRGYAALASVIGAEMVEAAACDLDFARPEPVGRWLLRGAAIIAAFAALVVAGALTAARVFHDPLARLIVRWGGPGR
jgi:general secretion pathway protein A